jgi:hypothetical protein
MQGLLTVDTADGEIRQEYEVLWRDCRGNKKSLAVCRLSIPGRNGSFQLIGKHPSKNPSQALAKAKAKLAKKCDKAKGRTASCNVNEAVCSVVDL